MDLQLEGKRVFVSGSTSGIGAEIARVFGAEGASVVVQGRNAGRAEKVATEIRTAGGTAMVSLGDLVDEGDAARVTAEVMDQLGGIDILVNNVGGREGPPTPGWFDVDYDVWVHTFELNVGTIVRMCHEFVPGMTERGWGRVINISSSAGTEPMPGTGLPDYASAKAGLNNLTAGLARSLAQSGVTVNTVQPGPVLTEAMQHWIDALTAERGWGDDPVEIQRHLTSEMLDISTTQIGTPDNVAVIVALLASPRADYITGANYRVDGGQCRSVN